MIETPELFTGNQARERFKKHFQDESCTNCHWSMDPVGPTFENYDAWALRDEENGGVINDRTNLDGETVQGPVEMAEALARSGKPARFVEEWIALSGDAPWNVPSDAC